MDLIRPKPWILPTIVISQFFCTSLWFAGNAVLQEIVRGHGLDAALLANLTSAVQFGFITGTLSFALLTIADRYSPSLIFFTCSIIAAACNLGILIPGIEPLGLMVFRFLTGFFLAGIYPVGMKIAADYYQKGLGKSLGYLVGALVLGTALPHLLKSITSQLPWKYVIFSTSVLSAIGGLIMYLMVPDGPFRKAGQKLRLGSFLIAFGNKGFRSAAFGYFGHMWELYAFWAFVPVMLALNKEYHQQEMDIPFLSFLIIGCGGIACIIGGLLSQYFGAKRIATISLFLSCICCLASPFILLSYSSSVLIGFLFFWGLVVIADSPMFSTLVAQNVREDLRGTSLTIVNCIGFSITIVSIQLLKALSETLTGRYLYLVLAIGPVIGLIALLWNSNKSADKSNS